MIEKSYYVAFSPLFGNIFEKIFSAISLSFYLKKMKESQLESKIAKAESKNLNSLVQIISHDIANPLTIIMGSALILKKTTNEDKKEKSIKRIQHATQSISEIIEQVRRIQAIKSGKAQIQLEDVSVEKIFLEVKFNLEDKADAKGIELIFQHPKEMTVWAEPVSLVHEVLNNFVSNAIKFSEKGSKIYLKAFVLDHIKYIQIRDEGIGMPELIMKNIFSEHEKTSRSGTNHEPGTGFGMPLAKYFIDKYDASIDVKSIEKSDSVTNHGTTFTIQFKK